MVNMKNLLDVLLRYKMDKEDLRLVYDLLMEGEAVADKIDILLFTGDEGETAPTARGYRDGFFGRVTKLYNILYKYSKYDTEKTVEILSDDKLSLNEKFDKLFAD